MKKIVTLLLAFLAPLFADSKNITITELKQHITFLASDELEGRKPGSGFDVTAAEYIKKEISFPNTTFLGNEGFQTFQIITKLELGKNNTMAIGKHQLTVEQDYIPMPFSIADTVHAQAAWLGYGLQINEDSLKWDDYSQMNVSGKWAVILFGDPEMDKQDSPFARYSAERQKVLKAKDMGAAGVIFVSGPEYDSKDKLSSLKIRDSHQTAGLPIAHMKRSIIDSLLMPEGESVSALEKSYNENRLSSSFALETEIHAEINVNRMKGNTSNVVAVIPGSDEQLKDEYIVIGAHYDHLGWGGSGTSSRAPDTTAIHNGADDNASGTAGIMELLEKFAKPEYQPKRSILFISFGAEEMGLLGSNYFVKHPLVDLDKIKFMMNFDMIGRLDSTNAITANGTGTAVGLSQLVEKHAEQHHMHVNLVPEGLGPSDHAAFYAADIPVLMFFTDLHSDYHTPNDDIEFINFEGEKQVLDFAFDLIKEIADKQEALVYQEAGPKERRSTRRRFKVTFGIMPDHAADVKGLRVGAVMPERPAFHAGIKKGDVIIGMDGKNIENIYDYMYRLGGFESGQRISVKVKRDEEIKIFIVEL